MIKTSNFTFCRDCCFSAKVRWEKSFCPECSWAQCLTEWSPANFVSKLRSKKFNAPRQTLCVVYWTKFLDRLFYSSTLIFVADIAIFN